MRILRLAAVAVLAGLAAHARADDMAAMGGADHAMTEGMAKMDQGMAAAPMTGDADHDFAAMMIPHHQGAIDMARAELKYGKDPAMRKLATAIVAAQDREIALMKGWLAGRK